MSTFLEELEGHVRALNRDLLRFEKLPEGEEHATLLRNLFRTAHTLKSAARTVNADLIANASHQLEEILTAAREGNRAFSPALFELFFSTLDAVQDAGDRIRSRKNLADCRLAQLLPRLEAAARNNFSHPEEVPPEKSKGQAVVTQDNPPIAAPGSREPASAPAAFSPASVPASAEAEFSATVRVPAEKLDALLAQTGELLIALRAAASDMEIIDDLQASVHRWISEWQHLERSLPGPFPHQDDSGHQAGMPLNPAACPDGINPRNARILRHTAENLRRLERDLERLQLVAAANQLPLARAANQLDEQVRHLRMLPFQQACEGLERMVRDIEKARDKQVEFLVEGGEVEMDRSILEALRGPLVHLIRNAADHGVETPEERQTAGKPRRARITVSANLQGAQVQVVVTDDGRGLDTQAIREQARKRGFPEPQTEAQAARLIFLPGFSTSKSVTDLSGRGVGLDVVKSAVEELRGTVDVSSTTGHGSRFVLTLPLTLTTLRALLVQAGGQTLALPGTHVLKAELVGPDTILSAQGQTLAILGGPPIPVAVLAEALGLPRPRPQKPPDTRPLVIVSTGVQQMGFIVDDLFSEQEIVVKSLGPRLKHIRNLSGACILANGRVALILNAMDLLRSTLGRPADPALASVFPETPPERRKHLLLAEDSITTRSLEKSILEAAGYQVTLAADGAEAWQFLREKQVDLVISDIEMPRMDGFELTEAIRKWKSPEELPVILVTSRASEKDRAKGIAVGADAYIVKSAFDQTDLLATIAQLL